MERALFVAVGSSLRWGLALAWVGLCVSCSSDGDDDDNENGTGTGVNQASAEACNSCGVEKCPNEAAACDDSPACVTWRDCTLDCASTDVACRNECTTAASNDANAIALGGSFVACATVNCFNECVETQSMPSPSVGPSPGPGQVGGSELCQQLEEWAAECAVGAEAQLPDCSALDATAECVGNCIVAASCAEFEAVASGAQNDLTTCMAACSGGTTPGPTSTPSPTIPPSTPSPNAPAGLLGEGGYVSSGSWQGFAWTGTDGASSSSIQPADYSASLGGALCAMGTVAGTADYSAVAMAGINLNQPNLEPTPEPGTWTPAASSTGVAYELVNFSGSPLRLQIQAPGGDTNANARFCAEIFDGAGFVAWSEFNTECWDGSGTAYNGTTPLEAIMVLVPGAQTDVAFDFCLQEAQPQ